MNDWLRVVVRTFVVTGTGVSAADVARRSHDLIAGRDGEQGHDLDDLLQAEGELPFGTRPDDFKELL